VHFPVFALFKGTIGGNRCLEGLFMDAFEGEVTNNVFDFAGFDVVFLNLW
jgi:hypothetical protein